MNSVHIIFYLVSIETTSFKVNQATTAELNNWTIIQIVYTHIV